MDKDRAIDAAYVRGADKPARDAEPRGLYPDPRSVRGAARASRGADRMHDDPPEFFVSEAHGLPLLSNNPAPLLSALHIPTLIDEEKASS